MKRRSNSTRLSCNRRRCKSSTGAGIQANDGDGARDWKRQFNFSAIANDLSALNGAVQYGNGLAYSMANLDDEFNARFPGYGSANPTNYAGMYRNCTKQSRYGSLGVEGCGLQYSQLNTMPAGADVAAAVSEFDDAVADASGWQLTCRAGTGRNGKTAPVDAH